MPVLRLGRSDQWRDHGSSRPGSSAGPHAWTGRPPSPRTADQTATRCAPSAPRRSSGKRSPLPFSDPPHRPHRTSTGRVAIRIGNPSPLRLNQWGTMARSGDDHGSPRTARAKAAARFTATSPGTRTTTSEPFSTILIPAGTIPLATSGTQGAFASPRGSGTITSWPPPGQTQARQPHPQKAPAVTARLAAPRFGASKDPDAQKAANPKAGVQPSYAGGRHPPPALRAENPQPLAVCDLSRTDGVR